jgi:hypothetical protein
MEAIRLEREVERLKGQAETAEAVVREILEWAIKLKFLQCGDERAALAGSINVGPAHVRDIARKHGLEVE